MLCEKACKGLERQKLHDDAHRTLSLIVFSFSNVKHATSTAGYAVNEMGGSAREVVLDIVSGFGCRNDSG